MSPMGLAITTVIAFSIAAFFAGAETAFLATDRIRLRHLARKGDRRARLVLRYLASPEYFLSIVLVGTNLGVVGGTATFTALMIYWLADGGATAASLILVPTLVVFQEILPKGIFLYYADQSARLSVFPMRFFAIVLYPVVKSFSVVSRLLSRLFRVGRMDRKVKMSMEELLFHLEGSGRAGLISGDTMLLVRRALDLFDVRAGDVMVPFAKVKMAPAGRDIDDYDGFFRDERFSRVPLYAGSRQQIVGILSVQNLLRARFVPTREPVIDSVYEVTTATPISEILVRMKNQGTHMAMVRADAGQLVGMVTLEDILERLVGAIADEFH